MTEFVAVLNSFSFVAPMVTSSPSTSEPAASVVALVECASPMVIVIAGPGMSRNAPTIVLGLKPLLIEVVTLSVFSTSEEISTAPPALRVAAPMVMVAVALVVALVMPKIRLVVVVEMFVVADAVTVRSSSASIEVPSPTAMVAVAVWVRIWAIHEVRSKNALCPRSPVVEFSSCPAVSGFCSAEHSFDGDVEPEQHLRIERECRRLGEGEDAACAVDRGDRVHPGDSGDPGDLDGVARPEAVRGPAPTIAFQVLALVVPGEGSSAPAARWWR